MRVPEIIPGRERPALQSVRRPLSYAIASAATCAPLGAAFDLRSFARTEFASHPSFDPESKYLGQG